jgi:hypothetical protein
LRPDGSAELCLLGAWPSVDSSPTEMGVWTAYPHWSLASTDGEADVQLYFGLKTLTRSRKLGPKSSSLKHVTYNVKFMGVKHQTHLSAC